MALSGVHISFSDAGPIEPAFSPNLGVPILPSQTISSQTMATTAVSLIAAPSLPCTRQPLLSISSSAAIYYAVGPKVTLSSLTEDGNGVGNIRYYDPALGGGREDIFVNNGDFFVWKLA